MSLDSAEDIGSACMVAPKVTAPAKPHFIVRVTSKGTPSLSRYVRVTVEP